MKDLNRVLLLIVTMIIISLVVVGMASFMMYRTALDEEKVRLTETAQSHARLIEAIARDEQLEKEEGPIMERTLSQIIDAHSHYKGFGETGEFTLARRVGDEIVFLLNHRHYDLEFTMPIPIESELAEPMRLALSGMSGIIIGLDYRGEKVLAAYEPVGELALGIVAKIDLDEIRSPFIRTSLIALGFAVLVIGLGAMLFLRITNPMIRILEESKERYRQLFENETDALMIFDGETRRFEDVNKATLDLFGYTRDEFLKLQLTDISGGPDKTKVAVDKIVNGEPGSVDIPAHKHKKKNGTEFFAEINIAAFISKGRKKIILAIRDITKRIKVEKEKVKLQTKLKNSEKMAGLGTLTSGIAHEFNNLLQIMIGHTEYAQRTKKQEDLEEALDIVCNTSDRVSKIIRDLFTFSSRDVLERELSSIPELMDFILSMLEEQMEKKNISVIRKYGRALKIEVNKGEIQQVFLNMAANARDAMFPEGGKLEIEIKKVKDNVEISFTDTGRGIKKENLSKIFEPFYTTKGAVGGNTRIQGMGLGLSVSHGIVERHGGSIEVESEVGKGTTFTIRLPVNAVKAKKRTVKEKKKTKAEKTKTVKILAVDDEEEICKMLTKWLSVEGHKVKSALTGRTAISLVKKELFDVVFLDIIMTGVSGIEVLEKIREISPKIKVIMMSGSQLKEDVWDDLKQKGASGFIQKPFKIEDIRKCLES